MQGRLRGQRAALHLPPLPSLPLRSRAAETTAALRQGPASGAAMVDCGAMCMPGAAEKVQDLIDDAVRKGATVAAGGTLPPRGAAGQFYPPTVVTGVTPDMRIWQEEVFGPVMAGAWGWRGRGTGAGFAAPIMPVLRRPPVPPPTPHLTPPAPPRPCLPSLPPGPSCSR